MASDDQAAIPFCN